MSTRYASGRRGWSSDALADLVVTTTVLAVALTVTWQGGVGVTHRATERPAIATLALAAASALPLLARRQHSTGVFAVTAAATIALVLVTPIGLPLGSGAALYTVAATRDASTPSGRTVGLVAGGFAAYVLACGMQVRALPWSELFHGGLLWAACWFAGERARLQRARIAELKRTAQHESELAAAEERARIARDLHDSAGHAINVIAVRAGAARLRHNEDPHRSLAALSMIEELARQTVADLDQIVGTLRGTSERTDCVPHSIASVGTLATLHRDAGLAVTIRSSGAPRPLNSTVDQAAYRIIQEGLTNASRHGNGAAALDIGYGDRALTISIRNRSKATMRPGGRAGHGLAGATERALLLGGSLTTLAVDGTFRLDATLPYVPCGARP